MPVKQQEKYLPYCCQQVFAVVNNVKAYQEFIPNCVSSIVHAETSDTMKASLKFNYLGYDCELTTANIISKPHSIKMSLLKGPCDSLQGYWQFSPCSLQNSLQIKNDNSACKLSLYLEYDLGYNAWLLNFFGSKFISAAFDDLFASIEARVESLA